MWEILLQDAVSENVKNMLRYPPTWSCTWMLSCWSYHLLPFVGKCVWFIWHGTERVSQYRVNIGTANSAQWYYDIMNIFSLVDAHRKDICLQTIAIDIQICQLQEQKTLCFDSHWGCDWHINDDIFPICSLSGHIFVGTDCDTVFAFKSKYRTIRRNSQKIALSFLTEEKVREKTAPISIFINKSPIQI